MNYVFTKSCVGYSHIQRQKPCQDFSSSYQDNERIIITCADGHGGKQYIRSQIGSKLACEAVLNIFKTIGSPFFRVNDGVEEQIKLLVLCEYNKLVEREMKRHPFRKDELIDLSEEDIDMLRFRPMKAYGTTLSGALFYKNKIVVISIGDTEVLGFHKGELVKLFDNSEDPAGNVTYSMCQEDAYQYLRVRVMNINELDGVLLCTDGMSSPYQSYDNFNRSFIHPSIRKVLETKSTYDIEKHVENMASSLGVGDDVSLAFVIKSDTKVKYYL